LAQVYQPGKGLAFHFDKDESLLVTEGRTVNPILSSVLYLTGSTQAGSRREGAPAVHTSSPAAAGLHCQGSSPA
jgi:hypothetical protein